MKNVDKYKNLKVCEVWEIYQKKRELKPDLTFQEFLDEEEFEFKFEIGDLIQLDHNHPEAKLREWNHDVVFEIVDRSLNPYETRQGIYDVKYLTPVPESGVVVGHKRFIVADFLEKVCRPY